MVEIVKLTKENILLPSYRGRLTEGLTYDLRNNTLIWVDIINAEAHRVYLDDKDLTERHEIIKLGEGESIGAVAKTSDVDTYLLCCKSGVSFGNFKTGEIKPYVSFPFNETEKDRLRSNDGTIDPWGNLWIGVMNDFHVTRTVGPQYEGYLYRIDYKTGEIKVMEEKTGISNGLAFSDDGKKFYWTDSPTKKTYSYDYDNETATLSNKQVLLNIPEAIKASKEVSEAVYPDANPVPDGMDFTAKNHFLSAVYSSSLVLEYTTEGEIVRAFKMPARGITNVLAAGKNGDELFINTAHYEHEDLSVDVKVEENGTEFGGHLFRYKADTSFEPRYQAIWGGKVE